ncbi:Thiamin ABC transporter, substrate-binding component [Klebsiella pneumoniae]|nr:Thiamin ABC transporter, substrate-binding component [Klebsiella pneumoniae]
MLKKLLPLLALVAMPALAKPVLTVYTYDSFSADWAPARRSKKPLKRSAAAS